MQSNEASRKKRRAYERVRRDPRLLQRLHKYIGEQEASRHKSSSCMFSAETDSNLILRKFKRKGSQATKEDEQRRIECASSDSNISDCYEEDRLMSENFANTSLRDVYLKSSINSCTHDETQTPPSSDMLCFPHCSIEESPYFGDVSHNNDQNTGQKFLLGNKHQMPLETAEKTPKVRKKSETKNSKNKGNQQNGLLPILPIQQSSVTFADVGGLNDTLQEICMLLLHLKHPTIYKKIGVKNPPRGFLLHGPPGCGKTLIAHAIAGELGLPFIKVAATELVSGISGESEGKIRELFDGAVSSAPCILFIDEIDAITPKREVAQREMEKRIVTQLLKCMDELNMKDATTQVMVIGATNRPHSLDPALRRAGRFDREISIGIPDENSRLQILKVVCSELQLAPDFNLEWLARNTPGYVGADLMAITREAANIAVSRALQVMMANEQKTQYGMSGSTEKFKVPLLGAVSWLRDKPPLDDNQLNDFHIEVQDFESALRVYVPSAKREGFATIPNVTWKDVGALKDMQDALQKAILWPVKYRKEFEEFHLSAPTGVLLCGPKGCGKTLLAKAVANECSINFLSVKGPELLSMYVGESERAVRECFQRAKNSSPCVIFFDEIDALCPARSSTNENAAAERVVNQLLTEIDGIEGRKQIFVMGATNRPENIDSAMLRPGRFEKIIFVGVPDQMDRYDILRTITQDGTQPKLANDVNLEKLSCDERCEGFSGADLASLIGEASIRAFEDYITVNKDVQEKSDFEVKLEHFEHAFASVRPSISEKDKMFFKKMNLTSPKKLPCFETNQTPGKIYL